MPSSGVQTCALRSEEHTSELQSLTNLVCRLLLEKNTINNNKLESLNANPISKSKPPSNSIIAANKPQNSGKNLIPTCCIVVPNFDFFFNDTATTEIYTLSLHDALPIYFPRWDRPLDYHPSRNSFSPALLLVVRSEEHTSELQSLSFLVSRLLLVTQ